ncbi:MAG: flippase-like domain-containing protein [Chitinophagales bacterium]|nr:flippase-like domain-containing protein [Chitinophagales bacterium]
MQHAGTPATKRKTGWLLLKLAVSAACIWFIAAKIDFSEAGHALKKAHWLFLFPALLLFALSKWISAIRLHTYFKETGLNLTSSDNVKLYWLGMFYNLFLPGSISGDAYKVIRLNKRSGVSIKKISAAVLLDRFSGLLGLGLLLSTLAFTISLPAYLPALLTAGVLLSVSGSFLLIHRYFPLFKNSFIPTLLMGILVQAVQLTAVVFILLSLEIQQQWMAYLFIFLLSSAAAVLPVTVGGLGLRELVFLQGAVFFQTHTETAILVSLLFYLITVFTSAWGAIWVFRPVLSKPAED